MTQYICCNHVWFFFPFTVFHYFVVIFSFKTQLNKLIFVITKRNTVNGFPWTSNLGLCIGFYCNLKGAKAEHLEGMSYFWRIIFLKSVKNHVSLHYGLIKNNEILCFSEELQCAAKCFIQAVTTAPFFLPPSRFHLFWMAYKFLIGFPVNQVRRLSHILIS